MNQMKITESLRVSLMSPKSYLFKIVLLHWDKLTKSISCVE